MSELERPSCWLVMALAWPDTSATAPMAECAVALAPELIPRSVLSEPGSSICTFARELSVTRGDKVVFFADMTGVLRGRREQWARSVSPTGKGQSRSW